jgi:hypothetical protein
MPNKLCCVLAPAGKLPAGSGTVVDFNAVVDELIVPAIREAGLVPVRTTDLEHLILCPFAVVDLTTGDPGLYLGLGAHITAHPGSTVAVRAQAEGGSPHAPVPLPVAVYGLTPAGAPEGAAEVRAKLAQRLREAREAASRHPRSNTSIDRLANDFVGVQHTKTDVFRDLAHYSEEAKQRLEEARRDGPAALRGVEARLGDLKAVEPGALIDLMLSYRAVKAWNDVVRLVAEMPQPLAESVMVQEQLAFALNRAGRGEEAEAILFAVLAAHGPSSETWALVGRVYKDRWDAAVSSGDADRARKILDQAIDAYLHGFEADWRDALPGINTVTLMELREPPDPRRKDLLPAVAYAVERRIATGAPDYWDYASRIELAVLGHDRDRALKALEDARGHIREVWEPETTRRNMRLIREAKERRGEPADLEKQLEEELAAAESRASLAAAS